ncbi:MAG: outer membrane protein assembly factor BamA [Acidobacteriota bacterium]
MKKLAVVALLLLIPLFAVGQELIERIEIEGIQRVTEETLLYYLSFREGDYYNPDALMNDFRSLWATGFFADIKFQEQEGESGKIIKVIVVENPVIKEISYKTGKKVKENDIVTKLKEKDEFILPYSHYSPYKIQKIEETIKELLAEKGLPDGQVVVERNQKGQNELEILFRISEGAKIRVGEVIFEGEPKLRGTLLREALKENKVHSVYSWIAGKDVFKENKLSEDLNNIKKKLQENGFMEATIGEPRIETITKRSIFMKKQTMKQIIIPVNAGYRYFVGDVQVVGNKIFNEKALRSLIKFKPGEVYSTSIREDAVEKIGELYRDWGYLFMNLVPTESLDPKNKKVNVTFNIYEGDVAYLNRLEFKGNNYTKDKVIRREMMLREGDRFSLALFKDSLLRLRQLGLVDLEGEPDIQPTEEDPTRMNVSLRVKELQRNNIQFTAGYSGYEGMFVAMSYSTVNFLGAGENFQIMLQTGKRIKNYSLGFTEPYLFDLPINVGFNVYNRAYIYPYLYNRADKGIDFTVSGRIKGYFRASLTYGYQDVMVELPTETDEDDPYYSGYGGYGGMGSSYGYNSAYSSMFGLGNYKVSYIMPSLYRNTIDSPLTPTKGILTSASAKFAGGFLGGEINIIKPRFEFSIYQPIFGRSHVLGFHAEYSYIQRFGDSPVPFWEKFYLGGERSIRGYDIYTIGPRSEQGTNLGGSKSLVFNAEYIIALGGPLYGVLFYDMGNSYGEDDPISFKNIYTSAGLEMRIFIPAIRVPFRLIFSYNNRRIRETDSNFTFRFAIGTTF